MPIERSTSKADSAADGYSLELVSSVHREFQVPTSHNCEDIRIFIQMKHANVVETEVFYAEVQ
jgi:hypothetical protein